MVTKKKADKIRRRHLKLFKKTKISDDLLRAMNKISNPTAFRKQFDRDSKED